MLPLSMADHRRRRRHLLLHVLLVVLLLRFSSAEFHPTDNYLLDCGSSSPVRVPDSRVFQPDTDSAANDGVEFSFAGSSVVTNPSAAAAAAPYRTARSFRTFSSYIFRIKKQGSHVVRLHFFPFSGDLSAAVFNVSVSGASLLTSFSAKPNISFDVKEFYLPINSGKFSIGFSATGFVSAIEVFSAPDELLNNTPREIVPGGGTKPFADGPLSAQILETVQRINVGGEKVTPENDPLWRNWTTDEDFLRTNASSAPERRGQPNYQFDVDKLGASREIAPVGVYGSLRELNASGGVGNLTWAVPVRSRRERYLVRMHFCDISSSAIGELEFDSFINGFSAYKNIDITTITKQTPRVPYYTDSVVDAGGDGAAELVVSVAPSSAAKRNAILNGLEIFKMNGELAPKEAAGKNRKLGAVALGAVVLGGLALAAAASVLFFVLLRRRRRTTTTTTDDSKWVSLHPSNSIQTPAGIAGSPMPNLNLELKLSFSSILQATKNFGEDHQIGQGGFGKVYRGVLEDGRAVAVKRGGSRTSQGPSEFYTEIMLLSKIRHRHLVSLVGYCDERSEMILVYEFMENGTLRDHLYGPHREVLPWPRRLEICIGAARGLHYLHTGSGAQGIIHRDVKSANILLDGNLVAKVSDFGLSKLGPLVDNSHVSTNVKGSFGYLDPEYFKTQQLTEKSDVYSFGVVLVEVLCARPAIDSSLPWEQQNLADWGLRSIAAGKLDQIVDPAIGETVDPNSLSKYADTVQKCLAQYGVDRPSMADVMWNLDYALKLQQTARTHRPLDDSAATILTPAAAPPVDAVTTAPAPQVPIPHVHDDPHLSPALVFSQLVTSDGR